MTTMPIPSVDGIVPVPLHIKSLRERGFNQSLLVARKLSQSIRIPLFMDMLIKNKETLPQIGLSARQRRVNIRNAFSVTGDARGMQILLFDDVMTTGATVRECSRELLKAGAREVIVMTLARPRMA